MSKKNKPCVVKDGVDFDQYRSGMAPKEVDVTEEELYEDQQQLTYHKDYNSNKNLKK